MGFLVVAAAGFANRIPSLPGGGNCIAQERSVWFSAMRFQRACLRWDAMSWPDHERTMLHFQGFVATSGGSITSSARQLWAASKENCTAKTGKQARSRDAMAMIRLVRGEREAFAAASCQTMQLQQQPSTGDYAHVRMPRVARTFRQGYLRMLSAHGRVPVLILPICDCTRPVSPVLLRRDGLCRDGCRSGLCRSIDLRSISDDC